eukprot:6492145-Amphidinium_carterae.2
MPGQKPELASTELRFSSPHQSSCFSNTASKPVCAFHNTSTNLRMLRQMKAECTANYRRRPTHNSRRERLYMLLVSKR